MIDIKGLQDVYQLRSAKGTNRTAKRSSNEAAMGPLSEKNNRDVIQISPEASFRARLDATSKLYAQRASGGLSAERLEELRQKYQGDNIPVSSNEVAQAILSHIKVPITLD